MNKKNNCCIHPPKPSRLTGSFTKDTKTFPGGEGTTPEPFPKSSKTAEMGNEQIQPLILNNNSESLQEHNPWSCYKAKIRILAPARLTSPKGEAFPVAKGNRINILQDMEWAVRCCRNGQKR